MDPNRVPAPLTGPFEAERERTITTLTSAFEAGLMTLEEYDERVELASTASTGSELEVLVQDLEQASSAMPSLQRHPEKETITSFFGNQKRHGQWFPARALKVRAILGEVRLDLGEANWPDNEIQIHCRPIFGSIVLRVPPDADVEIQGGAFFGDIDNRIQTTSAPKTKRVVIVGRVLFGSLKLETSFPQGIGRR